MTSVHWNHELHWEINHKNYPKHLFLHYFLEKLCVPSGFIVNAVISGADLTCSYSADFGSNARVEWKFRDLKGSQVYVVFDGKTTSKYLFILFGAWQKIHIILSIFSHFDRFFPPPTTAYVLCPVHFKKALFQSFNDILWKVSCAFYILPTASSSFIKHPIFFLLIPELWGREIKISLSHNSSSMICTYKIPFRYTPTSLKQS